MVPRVAAVRVILDNPAHEISPAWVNPRRAAADPRNWREAAWLARWVPRYTRRAALVVAAAIAAIDRVGAVGRRATVGHTERPPDARCVRRPSLACAGPPISSSGGARRSLGRPCP